MMLKYVTIFFVSCVHMACSFAAVSVDIREQTAEIRCDDVELLFLAHPPKLIVSYQEQERIVAADSAMITGWSGTDSISFDRVIHIRRRLQGFNAGLLAQNGHRCNLLVRMDAKKHIEIEILPLQTMDKLQLSLQQKNDEHFYGFGDLWHTESVDAKGSAIEMWNHTGTPDVCNCVPFYMSTRGYGCFIDCAYRGTMDFTLSGRVDLRFNSSTLSLHLWLGNRFEQILPQYLALTGYPPLPPKWVFTPQKWRDEGDWDEVFADVRSMQEHDIPLGVVWLDRPWMQGSYGSDDFIFDQERYADAEKRIEELHDLGIRVMVWGCDFLTPDSRHFEQAVENQYLIQSPVDMDNLQSSHFIVDFANPRARSWFKEIIKTVLRLGIDGIKLDRGQSYPLDVIPPSGRDPDAMHNYHAYLMVKTYAEALQEVRGNDYQLTPRAGWAGTQAWSVKWPGDLESDFSLQRGLPAVVRAQTAAGCSGFAYWGSDIGGFGMNLSKTCFIRWLQFGVFSPLMETGGKGNYEDAPFSWDRETVAIYRAYANLRMQLLPYIEKQAEQAHHKGIPIVRHLAWEWPHDKNVHTCSYQYLFGDDLLVAPVVDEQMQRRLYLPKGEWIDFWKRARVVSGPRFIVEKAPLARIPLFIRRSGKTVFPEPPPFLLSER